MLRCVLLCFGSDRFYPYSSESFHWYRGTVIMKKTWRILLHGVLDIYVKSRVVHAAGMPGTTSPPPRIRDPAVHHGTCVTHVPWCMPGSLPSGFLWSWWWGKRSMHFRRMRNPQFFVSGKRPMNPIKIDETTIKRSTTKQPESFMRYNVDDL